MWYFLFAVFWMVAYILSVETFIICATTAQFYFSSGGDAEGRDVSVCRSFIWANWHHCGSLAFGSFLIAVVQLLRAIFEYLDYKYREMGGDTESAVYKCVSCCVRCALWCLDCCVKFITEQAYIQVAISSENFCPSAFNAFYLAIRHAGVFGSTHMIDWMMMILGKGCIIAVSGLVTYTITV